MTRADQLERPVVSRRIAGDRVVLAVEFSGPLVVRRFARAVHAVHHALVIVAGRGIHDGDVLGRRRPAIFDLASLSFHEPTLGSAAKPTAIAAIQSAAVITVFFIFILVLLSQRTAGVGRRADKRR